MITIKELEEKLFLEEHIRIIFRAPIDMMVNEYPYKRNISNDNFYYIFQEKIERAYPNLSFIAIDGHGMPIERRGRKLGEIRETYI